MAEIMSLEQCFSVSEVSKYMIALKEIDEKIGNEIIKVADESLFGKKAFYCGTNHVTVKEKVKDANEKATSVKEQIIKLSNLIQKKAYEQRIEDLGKYIKYLNDEISKGELKVSQYQNKLNTEYSNIKEESDFGVQNRFNSARISEWRSIRISKDNQLGALDNLYQELEQAKAELTNAKIMVMHNFI